jgi:hypothetical protein
MTDGKTPLRLSGEDLMFLTEAVFAVSSGLGTNETRAKFLSNKEKVRRLMDLHDKYPNDVVEEAMNRLKDVVFSQGEDDESN